MIYIFEISQQNIQKISIVEDQQRIYFFSQYNLNILQKKKTNLKFKNGFISITKADKNEIILDNITSTLYCYKDKFQLKFISK